MQTAQAASRMAPAAIATAPRICVGLGRSPSHHAKARAKSTDEFRSVTIAPAPPRSRQERKIQNEAQQTTPAEIIDRLNTDINAILAEPRMKARIAKLVSSAPKKALSVSHRGFVLELGRNRFEGTGGELLANPDVRQHYLGG